MKKSILFLILCLSVPLFSRQSTPVVVTLNARVEPATVPLNRPLTLIVSVEWSGDLSAVEIGDVETPELANFSISGSGSSHRIAAGADGQISIKEIRYTLEPQTLGMAYIEPVILSYTDKTTDTQRRLQSQRFSVEILSPVAEPGARALPWPVMIAALLLFGAAATFYLRNRRDNQTDAMADDVPVEEAFLAELKDSVSLKGDGREAYVSLSRLFRRYLADGYGLPARETPTAGLIALMHETELTSNQVEKFSQLLSTADKVKFSGQAPDIAELTDVYTSFETLLERRLADDLAARSEAPQRRGFLGKHKEASD